MDITPSLDARSKIWSASVLHDPIDQAVKDAAAKTSVNVLPVKKGKITSPLLPTKDYSSLAKLLERK